MSETLPLSLAQHEVLQDQRAWPGSRHLLIGGYFKVHGAVDEATLAAAACDLADEQPVLRLCPSLSGQRLLASGAYRPRLWRIDVDADEGAQDDAVRRVWAQWLEEPMDPAAAPPWRIGWLRFDAQRSAILLVAHHSLMDGWGTAQFARRWAELYCARFAGKPPPPADPDAYLRHLQEDANYLRSPELARDEAFWAAELPQLAPPLFPLRPAAARSEPRRLPASLLHTLPLARADYHAWRNLADSARQTEFATFVAVLAWHFGRLAAVDEVLIGVPTLNRRSAAHRQALGMYVGVLPLRLALREAGTPRELAALAGRQMRQAVRHARYPASHLARRLGLARLGRDSAFELLLSFERQDYPPRFGDAQVLRTHQLFAGLSRYPLSVTVCDFGDAHDLELVFEGSAAVFDARALAMLAQRVVALAAAFARQPDAPLHTLPLLPPAERDAVLEGLHRDLATQNHAPSFVERFTARAALHPLSPALLTDTAQLSYGELAARMQVLAQRLLARGLLPGQLVPLVLARGPELVIAMLGVARAGGCFVPLDPDWPDERLHGLLVQLQAPLWLGDAAQQARLAPQCPGWMAVDGALEPHALPPLPAEAQPAYALFTSGSTGTPKCVQVAHGALARRFAWLARVWDLGPADRSLQSTQATFDPSLIELLLPLTLGASVALPPPGRQAPQSLALFAARHGCSFAALVPTTLSRLLDGLEALPPEWAAQVRLRVACSGGEVLPPALAQRWLSRTRAALWNVYGPTEACIFATAWMCRDGETASVLPVGTPIDDTRLYVLDADLQPLPFGTPGDIWLGGSTLAAGYLGQPEATLERFVPDPFVPGARMYRTGDRGWLDGQGRLQFLGRADRQLKIRGQRIEPGEIEATLLTLPGVREAHVQAVDTPARLHAWLAPASLDAAALLAAARQRLPEALVPTGWTFVDALPRTPAGKLDVNRLPAADRPPAVARRAPRTALEGELLALMQQALKRDDLGIDDDFFAAGGDSLAALDWLTAIEQRTGLRLDLGALALSPSVAQLAQRVAGGALRSSEPELAIGLSQHPDAPALFVAASGHGDRLRFQALADALGPAASVHMLQPPPGQPIGSMAELAATYGRHVAAHAGDAPVHVAGFSVGGVAALETARWLHAHGVAVGALVLIDSVYPRWLMRQPWLWRLTNWLTRVLYVQELSMNGRRLGAMFKDAGLVGQVLALHRYRVLPYVGEVLLLRTSGLAHWRKYLFGPWRQKLRLRDQEVQGLHGSVFEPGRVDDLAQCLRQAICPPPPQPAP